jgi:hypothetical protein
LKYQQNPERGCKTQRSPALPFAISCNALLLKRLLRNCGYEGMHEKNARRRFSALPAHVWRTWAGEKS